MILFPSFPIFSARREDTRKQSFAIFLFGLIFLTPILSKFSGDSGFEDGLAVVGKLLLHLLQQRLTFVQVTEQQLNPVYNPLLFTTGGQSAKVFASYLPVLASIA